MDEYYKQVIDNAFFKTCNGETSLRGKILDIEGMSGFMTRVFYNHICSMDDTRYLEIGVYTGSTFCSAMYNNPHGIYVAIDNFSEFDKPKEEFLKNIETFRCGNVTFYDKDCFNIDLSEISQKFNIFMYDGDHSYDSHYNILNYYKDVLDDCFIYIVDDYNIEYIRNATQQSIQDYNFNILYEREKLTSSNNKHPTDVNILQTFWNGMYVAVLSKK
jgi:hypothetical protein